MLACCSIGYSLQLFPLSNGSSGSTSESVGLYSGDWMSREIPLTNHVLCVSLNLSLPAAFHVKVDLVTNSGTTTVYNVDNVDEMVESDMLTVFEVKVSAEETVCQLMVAVSEGTVIRNIDIENDNCYTSGRFVTSVNYYIATVIFLHPQLSPNTSPLVGAHPHTYNYCIEP